jgi:hypothetical protein
MKRLWDPPTEIQASGFRSAARRPCWIAERCSEARVRFAAANPAASLPPVRRSADGRNYDGRLRRKPEAEQFLRLTQDENQCRVDRTS